MVFLIERKRMRDFFIKNGGPILEKINSIKIFKEEELKRITKNYSDTLGSGAFGVVYKGFLDDKQPIAVKKSKHTNKAQKEQFANEVIIQSRVIHKNIVRLIGCCLEVDVPLLVYEFVSNGNLEEIIHDKSKVSLTMEQLIVIAAESAEGLAYMHSKTSTNIQHGDVKPANILLDDNLIPKLSDFGISRLIARGNDECSEEVIGDNNYMDPVYRETGRLTNKSDVYSFGLVLYELITGDKAICSGNCSLVINHLKSYIKNKKTNMRSYINIKQDEDTELLSCLAEIARECLSGDVDQRPEMTDVAEGLQNIRKWYTHKSPYP
jgi:serine/threonine protein kinase